jgi:beta-lactamase regulating signal transducer with metallopeptidase domain
LLVLVKLVTPPLVSVPLSWPASEEEPESIAEASCPAMEARQVVEAVEPSDVEVPPVETPTDWTPLVAGAWLAGSVAFAGLALWRIARLVGWLRSLSAAPYSWQTRVDALAERIGLRRSPRVLITRHGAVPPLVVGLAGRPVLVFPLGLWDRLGESQRDAVLLHELAHLRRGDHRVRLLELAAMTLYWWFPLAWWASRRLRQAEEECCDTWVTWAAPDARPAYAAALVETVAFLSGQSFALPVGASGAGPVVAMKRRLSMILREKTPCGLSRLGWALMLGALALMPLMPTLARSQPKKETKGETPTTMNGLLSTKSCMKCHAPPPAAKAFDEDLHGRVIRLMDALKKQREQAEKTERELKAVLDRFEKSLETPKKAEAKWDSLQDLRQKEKVEGQKRDLDEKQKRLEQEARATQRRLLLDQRDRAKVEQDKLRTAGDRLLLEQKQKAKAEQDKQKHLEQELKRLLKQVDRLQRELEGKRDKPKKEEGGTAHYLREKAFEVPFVIQEARAVKQVSLFTRSGTEKEWTLVDRSKERKGSFPFTAPADGVYHFYLDVEGREEARAVSEWKPTLTVVVDTVRPVIAVSFRHSEKKSVEFEWSIEEAHPDLSSLRVEYRFQGERGWRSLEIAPRLADKFEARFKDAEKIDEVRVRMKDKAGNEGATIVRQ